MVIFHSYVSLPEGILRWNTLTIHFSTCCLPFFLGCCPAWCCDHCCISFTEIPWQVTVESTPTDPLDGSCVRYWFQTSWNLQCIYSQINIDPAKQVGIGRLLSARTCLFSGSCWFAGLFSAFKTSVPKSREEALQDWFPSEDHWTSPSHLQMSSSRKLVPTTPSS